MLVVVILSSYSLELHTFKDMLIKIFFVSYDACWLHESVSNCLCFPANLSILLSFILFYGNAVSQQDIEEIWGHMAELEEKVHSMVTTL